jgi:hypothetical protein
MSEAKQARTEYRQLEAAFTEVRSRLLDKIADSAIDEADKRERLYFGIQALGSVQAILIAAAAGADIEDHVERLGNPPAEAGS